MTVTNQPVRLASMLATLLSLVLWTTPTNTFGQQASVKLTQQGERFELLRQGERYVVCGVGGRDHLPLLAKVGGNSIRTWSSEGLDQLLDEALQNDLTVCVGMWLGHPRHGFDYQDDRAVLDQLDQCLQTVRKYKDHPAVLMWGIGNEMEADGDNPAIWYAVNHIASEIKRIDPNHPTMTVIAELGVDEVKLRNLERFCPDIDIVGVNSYGGMSTLAKRYRDTGIRKPYIVTEHGPIGPWEVGKTRWGSPIEATSTEKAIRYSQGFQTTARESEDLCLGTYAFLWGHKQETTATWFGMLLPDGSRTGAVDAMSEQWKGGKVTDRCPVITNIKLDRVDHLKPGEQISATLQASDPEGSSIQIDWVLRHDSGTIGVGGDFQAAEKTYANSIKANGPAATITIPDGGGGYRLFAYVRDGNGGAAVANVPFFVEGPMKVIESPKAKLPLVVYDEQPQPPFEPSGYMGNTQAITMKFDSTDQPFAGSNCLEVTYDAADNWGGVLWQSPANDWDGELPGGLNLNDAEAIEFYARGKAGGEVVSFMIGVIQNDSPYRDSAKAELKEVKLTTQWQKYRLPLNGLDLKRIKTGFGWSAAGQGKPMTFFLDQIRYVSG
ncbi:hypothetical protein LOC67_03050 [Stieleria sp. JC731]|uniref:glycoside hydrolase family 2 TIM barrel-domain containing protein n=1 Tax=Pirellulaceae TaxID=2691357 RepID=UPI001E4C24BD|nr:glycoside hydrolase family 2 TIM barrel-domain containing protein [Stieleria sp. JC731]MCC9599524.1 hypothetical protein [Stieleria sp. JC731]